MKQFSLTFFILFICLVSHAQERQESSFDSSVKRTILRWIWITQPDGVECDSTGRSLIQVYVLNDSIKIKSLYSSGNCYDFDNDRLLTKGLNSKFIGNISKTYNVIIPIYFYYDNGVLNTPSKKSEEEINSKIKKIECETLVLKPIITIR